MVSPKKKNDDDPCRATSEIDDFILILMIVWIPAGKDGFPLTFHLDVHRSAWSLIAFH